MDFLGVGGVSACAGSTCLCTDTFKVHFLAKTTLKNDCSSCWGTPGSCASAFLLLASLPRAFKGQSWESEMLSLLSKSWKSRISSLDSAAFSSQIKNKTYVRIKQTLKEMEKEWEAGSALAELEERCPRSQSQLGSVQGVRTWLIFIKKFIFKREKCQIISSLWLCISNCRAFPSSIYFIYT